MPHLGENSFFWQMPKGLSEEEREYYKVNATEMCDIFGALFTDGVTAEHMLENDKQMDKDVIGSSLAVIPGDGLNIVVSIGSAMVNKHLYIATLPIQIPVTVGTNDVLLRCDTTTEKPFVTAIVRKRTSTELTDNVNRTANVHEVPIATVTIPTGSQTVSETMIVDQRLNTNLASDGKPFCGLMKPRPNADTKGIWEDWTRLQAEIINKWKTFEEKAKQEWEEQKQGFNQSFETLIKDFDNQILNNQKTFEEWFNNLQTYLDGDVAANLAGEITRLKMEKANKNDVYTKKETDEKLKEKAENSVVVSLTNKVDNTRTYALTHSRAEATIIEGVTSDVGVGEKSPDNPYVLSGVETNGVTLYSLPNGVTDEYNAETGVLTKRVSKVVLNGSEVISDPVSQNNILRIDIKALSKSAHVDRNKLVCDKFISLYNDSSFSYEHVRNSSKEFPTTLVCYIYTARLNNYSDTLTNAEKVNLFKQWLSQNPVTVLYELATPETIQLTPKTTYQHTLSDLPTGQGIFQCQFIAQADYTEGDVFESYTAKPQGEETILPDKAFVKGDIVSVLVDTVNKKLGFKIGGSGVNQTLPPQIRSFAVTSGNAQNKLSWILPVDTSAYEGLLIIKKVGSAPTKVSDGTKINLSKTAISYTDAGLTNDTKYYYRAFPYNSKKQYQTDIVGAVVSATPKEGMPISNLPVGTLVKDINTKYYNVPIIWKIADKNHEGYPTNSTTLISDKILTLKCFDAREPDNSNSYRRSFGNNRYLYSNIRQWLNSNAGAGKWYSAQYSADAPPNFQNVEKNLNSYEAETGFLNTFSSEMISSIIHTSIQTVSSNIDGEVTDTSVDKVFILSSAEIGKSEINSLGNALALFNTDSSNVLFKPTQKCVDHSEYKTENLNTNNYWYYWLRDCDPATGYVVRNQDVNASNICGGYAYDNNRGIVPTCNVKNYLSVSLQPDTDGAYIIQF